MAYYAFVNNMAGSVGKSGPDTVNLSGVRRVLAKRGTDGAIGWMRNSSGPFPFPFPQLPDRVLMYNTADGSLGWRDPFTMGWLDL